MQRSGILGGTFNPPHWGHVSVAIAALNQFHLDEVLWIPSLAPHYRQAETIADFGHRLEMVKRAIALCPRFSLAFNETGGDTSSLPYPSFAVDTRTLLEATYPHRRWFWIIGLDALQTLSRWYQREVVIPWCDWLVAPRLTRQHPSGDPLTSVGLTLESSLSEKIRAGFTAVEQPASHSSTATRLNQMLGKLAAEFNSLQSEAIAQTTQQCQHIAALLRQQSIELRWQVLALPPIPISSQQIRCTLATHPPVAPAPGDGDQETILSGLVPRAIADYITQHYLYCPTPGDAQPP